MRGSDVKVALLSDMHGFLPPAGMIPEVDLLAIGGDVCPITDHGTIRQALWLKSEFTDWLGEIREFQPNIEIVGVAGNHDFVAENHYGIMAGLPWHYLEDDGMELCGLQVYGSPYSNEFGAWAFMEPEHELAYRWSWIPRHLDLLITHGPAYKLRDRVNNDWGGAVRDKHVGSKNLRQTLEDTEPRVHLTGHIHEGYGQERFGDTLVVNASYCDDRYSDRKNPIQVVTL